MKKRLIIAVATVGLAAGIAGLAVPAASADEISASSCKVYQAKAETSLKWANIYKKQGQPKKADAERKKAQQYYVQYKKCLNG